MWVHIILLQGCIYSENLIIIIVFSFFVGAPAPIANYIASPLAERSQTHLGWSKMGSNNCENCRVDDIAMDRILIDTTIRLAEKL